MEDKAVTQCQRPSPLDLGVGLTICQLSGVVTSVLGYTHDTKTLHSLQWKNGQVPGGWEPRLFLGHVALT